jgi:hypothetical protein
MGFDAARRLGITEVKPPRLNAVFALAAAILVGGSPTVVLAAEERPAGERLPAVAAPNLRLGVEYNYFHIDSIETTNGGTTLRIPNLDGNAGRVDLVGTFPVWGPIGGRLLGQVRYGHTQRNLDALDRGNNEITRYGGGAEIFLRDPEIGSFTTGGGYERDDGQGSIVGDAWNGTARLAIFFPDLGLGPVDWVFSFRFAHQQVSGTPGSVDIDSDRYAVSGSAGLYLSENFQFIMGGRWERAEEEFSSEDDREGFAQLRWRIPGRIPLELNLEGFAGISDYKQSPFRSESRLAYGVNVGVVLRFGSGTTLLESVRQYD